MEGPRAARAHCVAGRRPRRLRHVSAFVAVVLWSASNAGNECIAVNVTGVGRAPEPRVVIATNRESATDFQPSAPILDEDGRQPGSPLLIADARLASRSAARSAFRFDPSLDAAGALKANDKGIAKLSGGSPITYTHTIDDNSLHLNLPLDDFEETGPGSLKLSMAGLDVDSYRSVAGGRAQLVAADDERGRLLFETRLAWLFEYLQTDSTATAFFAPGDKGIYAVQGLGYGSNWAMLGGGLRWALVDGWSAYAGYDVQVNRQQMFHIGSVGFAYAW